MKDYKRRVLLGSDEDLDLVVANLSIQDNFLTIEYDVLKAVLFDSDFVSEYIYLYTSDMSMENKLDYLEKFDCKYSEFDDKFVEYIFKEGGEHLLSVINTLVDFSVFKESFFNESRGHTFLEERDNGLSKLFDDLTSPISKTYYEYISRLGMICNGSYVDSNILNEIMFVTNIYTESYGDERKWIEKWIETEVHN